MRNRVKDHNSDDEGDHDDKKSKNSQQVRTKTQEEIERDRIKDLPVIADSEISPAAYLF